MVLSFSFTLHYLWILSPSTILIHQTHNGVYYQNFKFLQLAGTAVWTTHARRPSYWGQFVPYRPPYALFVLLLRAIITHVVL